MTPTASAPVRETEQATAVARIAVVGLGYVGLPLAVRFAQAGLPVVGFDVNATRIGALKGGVDATNEVDAAALAQPTLTYSDDPSVLRDADFIIIAVPTPVTAAKQPDLEPVRSAARVVGKYLSKGTVVVLESTVYPGVTEDVLAPILAEESGLALGAGFSVGYSPERANPGDTEHTVDKIVKIVSGMDEATLDRVDAVYRSVCLAGTHRAPSIKTAEAAKVIENIQRDINIALMNELSVIFGKLGLNTQDVLAAAGTKWNFHKYGPGLVGGHCIPVDPYYLTYLSETIGYHPEVILAGRRINDAMAGTVADRCIQALIQTGRPVKGARILVAGLTFKENVNDTRNSKVADLIARLETYGVTVLLHDPLLSDDEIKRRFHGEIVPSVAAAGPIEALILAVPHQAIVTQSLPSLLKQVQRPGVFIDLRGMYRGGAIPDDIAYLTL